MQESRGFPTFPPHMSARCKARLILFSGFFFPIGLTPRGDKHTRSDPREPRPGTPLRGARSSALWRPLRPNGRTTPENKISRASGDDGQFGGRFPIPHRGGQLYCSTASNWSHSFARQRDRPPRCAHHRQPRATHTPLTPSHVTMVEGRSWTLTRPSAAPRIPAPRPMRHVRTGELGAAHGSRMRILGYRIANGRNTETRGDPGG